MTEPVSLKLRHPFLRTFLSEGSHRRALLPCKSFTLWLAFKGFHLLCDEIVALVILKELIHLDDVWMILQARKLFRIQDIFG